MRLLKRRVETILCELLADEVPTNGWLVASSGLALSLEENRNASGEESDRSNGTDEGSDKIHCALQCSH